MRRGGRGKDGGGGRFRGWEAGWMGCRGGGGVDGCIAFTGEQEKCVCVCRGGGGALSKPMGVYIMFYGYKGTRESPFH